MAELFHTLLYSLAFAIISLYARLMLQRNVHRHAPLPEGPALIVANHPSFTDPFYLPLLFRQKISLLIIESAFHVPVFGAFLRRLRHVPVTPGNGRAAFDKAHHLLKTGRSVAMFPEGNASPREGGFRAPRSGAARLALLTGVPVVPIGIYLPRERLHTIRSNIAGKPTSGYWYLRGPYSITVGRPLHFEGSAEDREQVASVSRKIMEHIKVLAHESEQRTKGRK